MCLGVALERLLSNIKIVTPVNDSQKFFLKNSENGLRSDKDSMIKKHYRTPKL